MEKKQAKKIVFIDPGASSGGASVFKKMYQACLSLDKNVDIISAGFQNGLFVRYWKLLTYLLFYKNKDDVIFFVTEPLQALVCGFSCVNYVRFSQADDLAIFRERLFPVGKILTFFQRVVSVRDKKLVYVSDYVLDKFLKQSRCRITAESFKSRPILDEYTLSDSFDLALRNKITKISNDKLTNRVPIIAYMPRRAKLKRSHEFFSWIKRIEHLNFKLLLITNEFTSEELAKLCEVEFEFIKPNSQADVFVNLFKADVFVFNSANEGFGLPPLEAKVCGCLVVSSDCGGVTEFLDSSDKVFRIGCFGDFSKSLSNAFIDLSNHIAPNYDVLLGLRTHYSGYNSQEISELLTFLRK